MTIGQDAAALATNQITFKQGEGPEVWVKAKSRGNNVAWGRLIAVNAAQALVADRDGVLDWVELDRIELRAEQDWGRALPLT